MGEPQWATECAECGHPLGDTPGPCPNCGAVARLTRLVLHETIGLQDNLSRLKAKDGDGNLTYKSRQVLRVSGKTKLPARNLLAIDRSDPEQTLKHHQVWERQPDGTETLEHDEHVASRAKHRPRSENT